jgi:hypothetical protein|tara:strand:+ start:175 stop:495 length:321 start_codon:yes stop_codon:yes gene_type:complete
MEQQSIIALVIAITILVSSVVLGMSNIKLNLKVMHSFIGFGFLFIVIFGLRRHLSRLVQYPTNYISWLHIIIFSFLIVLSIKALRNWFFVTKKKKVSEDHTDHNHT